MKKFQCTVRGFESSIDNLGWMCHIKNEGDDMEKFQCTTCGKISTDKNEICKAQAGIGAVYMCHDCNSKSSRAEDICNPVKMTPSYFCGTCGNAAVEKRALCEPVKL
jgi:predicted RNA-binding Zn-ribbon protein involved in translation (DUF1610 family)